MLKLSLRLTSAFCVKFKLSIDQGACLTLFIFEVADKFILAI